MGEAELGGIKTRAERSKYELSSLVKKKLSVSGAHNEQIEDEYKKLRIKNKTI